jgi:putative ABC transport system ATP-binding protein
VAVTEATAAAVDAVDLYRFYHAADDETVALGGVSLRVERGETVAVVGPSGSGKSTLLACIAGLDDPDGGSVRIAGAPMTRRPERVRAALRARMIGVLFQSGNLFEHLTVAGNVRLAQQLAGRVDRDRIAELLDAVGLTDRASSPASTLSGGESARAGLAVALANGPSVVLADEPTGEVDELTARRVATLLRRAAHAGAAVIVATHDPSLAASADRIIRLADGRAVG